MQGNVKRIKGRVPEKRLLFFWILAKWGGGGLPKFFGTFS